MKHNLNVFILLTVLSISQYLRPDSDTVILKLDGQEFPIPRDIIKHAKKIDVSNINSQSVLELKDQRINPRVMRYVASIIKAADIYKNLHGKSLLDAIIRTIDIDPSNLTDVLVAFDALGLSIGIEVISRAIASSDYASKFFMENKSPDVDDVKPLVARYYYLYQDADFAGVDKNKYGFSIQDYLDYKPKLIKSRIQNNDVRLNDLRINSLEGFENIPDIDKAKSISFSDNQIKDISAGFFDKCPQLEYLNLSRNQLTAVKDIVLRNQSRLLSLDLSENKINTIAMTGFEGLTQLKTLSLGMNEIKSLQPHMFKDLTQLQDLVVRNNKITQIQPGLFIHLSNLDYLSLKANQLMEIPDGAFEGLINVRRLDLGNNQIMEVYPGAFKELKKLRWLYLFQNRLSRPDQDRLYFEVPRDVDLRF